MVDPTFSSQLGHDRVDEWKACTSVAPRFKKLSIFIPVDLAAYRIVDHFVKIFRVSSDEIKKLLLLKMKAKIDIS